MHGALRSYGIYYKFNFLFPKQIHLYNYIDIHILIRGRATREVKTAQKLTPPGLAAYGSQFLIDGEFAVLRTMRTFHPQAGLQCIRRERCTVCRIFVRYHLVKATAMPIPLLRRAALLNFRLKHTTLPSFCLMRNKDDVNVCGCGS